SARRHTARIHWKAAGGRPPARAGWTCRTRWGRPRTRTGCPARRGRCRRGRSRSPRPRRSAGRRPGWPPERVSRLLPPRAEPRFEEAQPLVHGHRGRRDHGEGGVELWHLEILAPGGDAIADAVPGTVDLTEEDGGDVE